jgi:hypothetical protein
MKKHPHQRLVLFESLHHMRDPDSLLKHPHDEIVATEFSGNRVVVMIVRTPPFSSRILKKRKK